MEDFIGIIAVTLFFAVPISAIALGIVAKIKKNRLEAELRKEIIRGGTSLEMAQELLKKPIRKHNKMVAMRWGCTFVGVGLAALVCNLAGLYISDIYTWLYFILGGGIGLVIAFVIEMAIDKHQNHSHATNGDEV